MIYEFDDPLDVTTPLGKGRAIFVDGTGHDYYWTVILNDTLAIVTFTQDRIRAATNYTHRRGVTDERMRDIIKPS